MLILAVIATLALLVHGYHLGSDDAEIYIPAIKRVADPALFPFDSQFFMMHARLSYFSNLIGDSARLTALPVDWAIFLWHAGSIFLLLLAARQLLKVCFQNEAAQWAGVALLAGVLTVPVAGTALVIMDPYLTARSLSTPAILFAIASFAARQYRRGLLWLLFTMLIHPQMGSFGAAFLGCMALAPYLTSWVKRPELVSMSVFPWGFDFTRTTGVYREVLFSRPYFFVSRWEWWEWVGVAAPLLLLGWLARRPPAGTLAAFRKLSAALVVFGLGATAGGLALSSSVHFESFERLQPMRSFHLLYVIFFLFLGGLMGEYLLRERAWRWCCLFIPLAAGMWTVQAQAYPHSAHVEWPGAVYRSGWPSAFLWIRDNTPKDAIFALDPNYMAVPGDDQHGFRALAERSALADNLKDSGAVSLFPELADDWKSQVMAEDGWRSFALLDYEKLASRYRVDWLVVQRGQATTGLACPYRNDAVSVCRVRPTVAVR